MCISPFLWVLSFRLSHICAGLVAAKATQSFCEFSPQCVIANQRQIAASYGSVASVNYIVLHTRSGFLFSIWFGTLLFAQGKPHSPGALGWPIIRNVQHVLQQVSRCKQIMWTYIWWLRMHGCTHMHNWAADMVGNRYEFSNTKTYTVLYSTAERSEVSLKKRR